MVYGMVVFKTKSHFKNPFTYCQKSPRARIYTIFIQVMIPNVPKRNVLLSYRPWEVLRFKFERSFKNYLVINCRLVI